MELVVTLMAAEGLSQGAVAAARDALREAGGETGAPVPVDGEVAVAIAVSGLGQSEARAAVEAVADGFDTVVQSVAGRRVKRLLVADMDSTIIGQECIDELADFAGKKAEISAITERAMLGELDFSAALQARVMALAGLDAAAIGRTLSERVRLNPGARTLIATMKAHGCRTVLVSGGFTAFSADVAARAGFERHVANVLDVKDGRLTGAVAEPIVDSATKRQVLESERAGLGLAASDTLAVGDGANDIPMLEAAGLGIAYHAKPRAAAAADAAIRHGDLTAILWAQGIARARWVEA
ncbi:MAG: phosphoserine phosphatase SerB [Thermaurantiacus sp.]